MARLPIIPEYQDRANALTTIHPLTIQSSQNTRFLQPWARDFAQANSHGREQDVVRTNFNPVAKMMRRDAGQAVRVSNERILTTVLSGIRQSGSMMRTARVRGLGAVDCSTIPPSTWSGAQADAMMAFMLATTGTPDYVAAVESVPEIYCYTQFLNPFMQGLTPSELAAGDEIVKAITSDGGFPGVNLALAAAFAAGLQKAHGLTAKRAVELFRCGVTITKAGGWAKYTEIWPTLPCSQAWYENPLYLGVGAAALIGAVWFATKKKR